jgi:hypothetical protein
MEGSMTEQREARAALDAAEARLTVEQRAARRKAGAPRKKWIEQGGGTYRAALRRADGTDAVERR